MLRHRVLLLGSVLSFLAASTPAADDLVGGESEPVTPLQSRVEVEPAADAGAAPGPFIVSLANGDRITGALVALDAGSLRIRPDVNAAAAIDLPVAGVEDVGRSADVKPLEPRGDRVFPIAGGVIHGTLEAIDAQGITLDVHLVGRLTLPLGSVAAFVRKGCERPERTAPARFHEIHDGLGSRLIGHVEFTPSGPAIRSEGLAATVALRDVDAILFPNDGEAAARVEGEPRPSCTIELVNGSEIVGVAPSLEDDRVVVGLGGGRTVPVPLDHVSRMWFSSDAGPLGGRQRVVFWSTFADADEEGAHMIEALREGLPRGWEVDADGKIAAADDLGRAIQAAGVLVVPEMESFDADEAPDAAEIGRVLRGFLGRGGTVVIAGADDSTTAYWRETGLFSLESSAVSGGNFKFVPGHDLAEGVGESFTAANATCAYETTDKELEPIAKGRGGAAVLTKKVGRGSIVLLGMDFYERNKAIDRLLLNSVTRKRGR